MTSYMKRVNCGNISYTNKLYNTYYAYIFNINQFRVLHYESWFLTTVSYSVIGR